MQATQDTEITLGTGKMLALFFGLVILCAVFFGMGFSLGRNSEKAVETSGLPPVTTSSSGSVRPSAVKPPSSNSSTDPTLYKPVGQKATDPQPPTTEGATNSSPAGTTAPPDNNNAGAVDPAAAAPSGIGYYVQVAAVSKQEDADALVDALKKKQYPAFAVNNAPNDKLFHVQIGPFSDIKDAEAMRAKLVSDGYNPILKK
jgi:DedD protein